MTATITLINSIDNKINTIAIKLMTAIINSTFSLYFFTLLLLISYLLTLPAQLTK